MAAAEDVAALDLGNILFLQHLDMSVPDQLAATVFYVVGLGLTRNPYRRVDVDSMQLNIGESQLHMDTSRAQLIGGRLGLVVPDLEALEQRLESIKGRLTDTRFAWARTGDYVDVTCPWGNNIRCHGPGPRFGYVKLGIAYIERLVRPGAAAGIARFYEQVLRAPTRVETDGSPAVHVLIGPKQELIFRETSGEVPPYDGYHVSLYVANFSGPYTYIKEHGLLTDDIRFGHFRFQTIIDPESGEPLCELEHEMRHLHDPQFRRVHVPIGRTLVDRDA